MATTVQLSEVVLLPKSLREGRMAQSRAQGASRLYTPRVLIVEDVYLVAEMIAYMVADLGYEVSGVATDASSTLQELAKQDFHAVLLDCTLDNEYTSDIADLLLQAATPFAFVVGRNEVPKPHHGGIPVLPKPFSFDQLQALLGQLIGSASSSVNFSKAS